MTDFQRRRWDKRNTLRFKKYAYPFWFLMNLMTCGMLYLMMIVL